MENPPQKRPEGKLASTKITNEIVTWIQQLPISHSVGTFFDPLQATETVWFKIISDDDSGDIGKYKIAIFPFDAKTENTGDLAEEDLGTPAGNDQAIGWHMPEILFNADTNILASGGFCEGRHIGVDKTGKIIVAFAVLPIGKTGSPIELSGDGTEADTDAWNRIDDGKPVTVQMSTGAALDTTAHKLYGFYRVMSFDACGLLTDISEETRYEIDTTEDCSA